LTEFEPAYPEVKQVTIDAVVIRADGTREDLGTIADSRRGWRYSLHRVVASLRTRQANRRHRGNPEGH
jgi:hypothetical protein